MARTDYRRLIAAYGSDPKRWPTKVDHAELQQFSDDLRREQHLDALLDRAEPDADPAAAARVLAALGRLPRQIDSRLVRRSWIERIQDGFAAMVWPKVAALAMASLIGIGIGMTDLAAPLSVDTDDDLTTLVLDSSPLAGLER
jgi:hypothetical protein